SWSSCCSSARVCSATRSCRISPSALPRSSSGCWWAAKRPQRPVQTVERRAAPMSENVENVLRMENVTMQFGGVVAVNNLSIEVNKGEIVALIGPNGAGKTTAFNCVTGVYQPTNGRIEFMGNTIIRNHPQGKMAKEYLGEDAKLYTAAYDGEDDPDTVAALDALNAECAAKVAEAEDAIVKKLDSEKDEAVRKALYAEAETKKAEIEAGYAEPREKLLVQLKDRADARMGFRRSIDPDVG